MEVLDGLDSDGVLTGCQGREHDEGTVGLEDLANLVHAAEQDAINFRSR